MNVRIRDPIHGTLLVADPEQAVIDSPYYQRLRHIRQLGFGEMAFPGATHTRHAHSLGAMHVSGRLFGAVAARARLPEQVAERFVRAVRAAVLCHDLGHMPLSHASEGIAPLRSTLKLPAWVGPIDGQATHEDFTVRLILDSPLTTLLGEHYHPWGITAQAIAGLVTGADPPGGLDFHHAGEDWTPLLRALVSGELDADRMDYLLRDSFYTGVNYGRYDLDWIIQNLYPASKEGRVHLALSRAASFAFEDFLLSRYHMFVSVYLHHTAVNFDHMLARFFLEAPGEFEVPPDPERFLGCDDVALAISLRNSRNPWAQRIVSRRGFKLLAQFTERDEDYDLDALAQALTQQGVQHFTVESRASLSKYMEGGGRPSLYIIDESTGRLTEVERYTPLYQRYAGAVRLRRVFVLPEQLTEGRNVLARHIQ
jgi:HD superfamily phosphohydrolase